MAKRRVSAQGRISLYNRNYYVGMVHSGKNVVVSYDPQAGEWFVTQQGKGQLRRLPAPEICRQRILALDISAK